ncbi:MAG: hydroxyisourate hydrolase, partial [Ginsengibacter sp.]
MKYFVALFLLFSTNLVSAQTNSYQLSTHILDIGKGLPAPGVTVELEKLNEQNNSWSLVDSKITDTSGRIGNFLKKDKNNEGIYKLVFKVAPYFERNHTDT